MIASLMMKCHARIKCTANNGEIKRIPENNEQCRIRATSSYNDNTNQFFHLNHAIVEEWHTWNDKILKEYFTIFGWYFAISIMWLHIIYGNLAEFTHRFDGQIFMSVDSEVVTDCEQSMDYHQLETINDSDCTEQHSCFISFIILCLPSICLWRASNVSIHSQIKIIIDWKVNCHCPRFDRHVQIQKIH